LCSKNLFAMPHLSEKRFFPPWTFGFFRHFVAVLLSSRIPWR